MAARKTAKKAKPTVADLEKRVAALETGQKQIADAILTLNRQSKNAGPPAFSAARQALALGRLREEEAAELARSKAGAAPMSKASAIRHAKQWLVGQQEVEPTNRKWRTKAEAYDACRRACVDHGAGHLSERQFKEAWREDALDDWKKPGAIRPA